MRFWYAFIDRLTAWRLAKRRARIEQGIRPYVGVTQNDEELLSALWQDEAAFEARKRNRH